MDAPVTLLEYCDYECPYCGIAYPVVKEIQLRVGDRLRLVFRNFPLAQMHPHARQAAEAAEVAGSLGAFWEMQGHSAAGRVQEDLLSGIRSGVNGTPTFFINALRYDGQVDVTSILAAVTSAEET